MMRWITRLALVALVGVLYVSHANAQGALPIISSGGIVNAASFTPAPNNPASPCALISIFGESLAAGSDSATMIPLPRSINGTQVFINNIASPLIFVSPSQINAQVPCEVTPGSTINVFVQVGSLPGPLEALQIQAATPGVFSVTQNGMGAGAILHANFTLVDSNSPVVAGETILIFCTGLGETVSPQIQTGEAGNGQLTLQTPTVTIGGQNAQVVFSGAAPGFVGLYQINVIVPNFSGGDPELLIDLAGQRSRNGIIVPTNTSPVVESSRYSQVQ
ncbi:MAG: hypothetical protein O7E51_00025 [Acidobacteria bacterium]|nr:hypothetical protein [Acidobacteriota bacterium]